MQKVKQKNKTTKNKDPEQNMKHGSTGTGKNQSGNSINVYVIRLITIWAADLLQSQL